MLTLYYPNESQEQAGPASSSRLPPTGERFWIWREQKRYEFLAEKLRELDSPVYADLCSRWADQARMEIEALARVDQRIAALDAELAAIKGRRAAR